MSVRMIQAFKAIQASPTQRLVAYMLADAHNEHTERCDPSIATLIDLTGLSNRAVSTAIIALQKAGHLTVSRIQGARSRYRLHPRSTFTSEAAAPPQEVHGTPAAASLPPPQEVHDTPAAGSHEPERTGSLTGKNRELAPARQEHWPLLQEVKACAELIMAPSDCAEKFWNDCEAVGWLNRFGLPLRDWRPVFHNYATRWKFIAADHALRRRPPPAARAAPPNQKPGEIPSAHTRLKDVFRDRTLDP